MSKIITYKNSSTGKYCQIKFDDGNRILISLIQTEIKIFKLNWLSLPKETLFEISTLDLFSDKYKKAREKLTERSLAFDMLDVFKEILIECHSLEEALKTLDDIFQVDEVNQPGWTEFLNNVKDDEERKHLEKAVLYFMQLDSIDYLKVAANITLLFHTSRDKSKDYAKSAYEVLSPSATPSMDNIVSNPTESDTYPNWFRASYPDVVLWFAKLSEDYCREILNRDLSTVIKEDDLKKLRRIVDAYKEERLLECTKS